jgi:hypothetical protein
MDRVNPGGRLRAGLRHFALLWLGVALAAGAWAADGRFEIRRAFAEPVNGVWQLNATLDLSLSRAAREALDEGIPLTLVLDIVVTRERRLLPDEDVAELQQRWQLTYDALSGREVVTNLNSGAQATYPSLDEALAALSRITALPMIDEDLLAAGVRHEVSLRASVEIGGMPSAVKLLVFWREWSRSTDWYTWSIRP